MLQAAYEASLCALVELGVPIDAVDPAGRTVLFSVDSWRVQSQGSGACLDPEALVQRLLLLGADPQHRDAKGRVPADVVVDAGARRLIAGVEATPERLLDAMVAEGWLALCVPVDHALRDSVEAEAERIGADGAAFVDWLLTLDAVDDVYVDDERISVFLASW